MARYAIGDIHGCLNALKTVLAVSAVREGDTIVFLGDYIDRGLDSKGVIEWIIALRQSYKLITLRGNHEIMMMESRRNKRSMLAWLGFGGEQTLDSYGIGDDPEWVRRVPPSHWDFLEQTQAYYEDETDIFVHAGLYPWSAVSQQRDDDIYWKKYYDPVEHCSAKRVICGHTARKDGHVADFRHTVCIDTFCYGGQFLTCLNVDNGQYWQKQCIKIAFHCLFIMRLQHNHKNNNKQNHCSSNKKLS